MPGSSVVETLRGSLSALCVLAFGVSARRTTRSGRGCSFALPFTPNHQAGSGELPQAEAPRPSRGSLSDDARFVRDITNVLRKPRCPGVERLAAREPRAPRVDARALGRGPGRTPGRASCHGRRIHAELRDTACTRNRTKGFCLVSAALGTHTRGGRGTFLFQSVRREVSHLDFASTSA